MIKGPGRFEAKISAKLRNIPNVVESRLADLIDVLIKVHCVVQYNINVLLLKSGIQTLASGIHNGLESGIHFGIESGIQKVGIRNQKG